MDDCAGIDLDEVFEIAVQIERNGSAFYRRASVLCNDPDCGAVFRGLAAQETSHEAKFADMRRQFAGRRSEHERNATLSSYLQTIAGSYVFNAREDPRVMIGDDLGVEAILQIAMDRERDAIKAYTEFKGWLCQEGHDLGLQAIIDEEREHLAALSKRLRALQTGD